MRDERLEVKARKGKRTRCSALHRIKARSQEEMSNAGIAMKRVTSITNERNRRKPTRKRVNPRRMSPRRRPNRMAERMLLNPTQKAKEHGRDRKSTRLNSSHVK